MNQTLNATLLTQQHFLFDKNGSSGVGYFPYRGQVIVVLFDASYPDSFNDIKHFSCVWLVSVDFARHDWNTRINGGSALDTRIQYVRREYLSDKELKIRTVLLGLAVKYRDKQEETLRAEADGIKVTKKDIYSAISDVLQSMDTGNTVYQNPHEHNTQYALKA